MNHNIVGFFQHRCSQLLVSFSSQQIAINPISINYINKNLSDRNMHEPVWAACRCYYQKCIHSKSLDQNINFIDKETFLREYEEVLAKSEIGTEEILKEILDEVERRKKRSQNSQKNRDTIKEGYKPLHNELFDENSGQIEVVKRKAVKIKDDVFTLPIMDTKTCNKILEELNRYLSSWYFPISNTKIFQV